MANDLNLTMFIGRLGRDPAMHYMPSGDAVASFSLAVGSTWKDKSSGETKESTEWVTCTVFGKLAEVCGEYLKKGKQVYVSGRMKTEKYQDKETGADRYSTKIIVDRMQMLADPGARSDSGGRSEAPAPAAAKRGPAFNEMDDDIPF